MTTELAKKDEGQLMEGVLLGGDLSKLTPTQRVTYYQRVCESIGLNPLTKPFAYITLNNKLTLYVLKDAADQLRKLHGVSIDDVDITESETQFVVKVKGHDSTGRTDVEVGVVNKKDMQGRAENVQMKAVTKAKRRLTLSICGLGLLDETEIQTIPDAHPVEVADTGEIMANPDPVDPKTKDIYLALCHRAEKVDVHYKTPNWETTTKEMLRLEYRELLAYVEDAERQVVVENQDK